MAAGSPLGREQTRGSGVSQGVLFVEKVMSNNKLPVAGFRDQIISTVAENPVTIITAETGAGKSTQVPQYLLDEGYNIVVTQPRRLAARTVAERVAKEYGTRFGDLVGFRTAHDRQDSDKTRCLFVTDGLALVRELMGTGTHNCLVLDEVHEWNLNIEVLVAWVKRQVAGNPKFKVVLMSATLEAEALAEFFDGAPVIEVPGRTFPVEEREVTEEMTMHETVAELARQGRNVLVFQPGKAEIGGTIEYLRSLADLDAEVLPLHGELTKEQQALCFRRYSRPKIVVSTNVAQTSVTIDDIDAVVDSGMERRIELVNGVEGLYLRPISLADAKQRRGRAGRVKPGVYYDFCPVKAEDRREFPMAEILRVRLDQTVLRLAIAGFDMEELRFFHQPDIAEIHEAKRALRALGCMDDEGRVTAIGRAVSRLPISVQYGRMIVEAEKLGVVGDVIKIAAILEQGGITARKIKVGDNWVDAKPYWSKLTDGEKESDAIAQLRVFENAQGMSKSQMYESGIFVKDYHFAKERIRLLRKALKHRVRSMDSTGNRADILKAVLAGMVEHLYKYNYGDYQNGDGVSRHLTRESVVGGGNWLVGKPFDLEIKTRWGTRILYLINMVTKADPMILAEVAPQLVTTEAGLSPRYDAERECVVSTTKTLFNGMVIKEEEVADPDHPEAPAILDEQAWKEWSRPELPVPNFSLVEELPAEIPAIREEVYATSRVDGCPLFAYGVVYYDSCYGWRSKWIRDREEAERLHERAEEMLAELRKEKKVRDRILREQDAVNRRREAVGLPPVKARETSFSHGGWSKDYTEENWNRVLEETERKERKMKDILRLKPVFEELNRRREAVGLSTLELGEERIKYGWDSYNYSDRVLEKFVSETEAREAELRKEAELADWVEKEDLPGWLVESFGGNLERLREFVSNVDALDPKKLRHYEHEVLACGRARRSAAIIKASGGNENFFCGADPNDVAVWIWERVMGESSRDAEPDDWREEKNKPAYSAGEVESSSPFTVLARLLKRESG